MLRLIVLSALCNLALGGVIIIPHENSGDNNGHQSRIVGGKTTTINHLPWQVSMRAYNRHQCGGSIIGPTRVLTAAHCLPDQSMLKDVFVRAGSSFHTSGGIVIPVAQMIPHEKWDYMTIDNDIALLILTSALEYGPTIQPVKLPSQGVAPSPVSPGIVSGWGLTTAGGSQPDQLQFTIISTVADAICQSKMAEMNPETMICAGADTPSFTGPCNMDSGGPLIVNEVLQGIVSWGYGCADPKFPSVFSRVSMYRNWIDSH